MSASRQLFCGMLPRLAVSIRPKPWFEIDSKTKDAQIEHIGWALKAEAEAEAGYPSGSLYLDSLATAVATHLVRHHDRKALLTAEAHLSPRGLKSILNYIDNRLSENLSSRSIASIAGLSPSHFKVVFRKAMGIPVHQYVIRRRVQRAASLLEFPGTPISQVALEVGFSHQSHMAFHMRRASPQVRRLETGLAHQPAARLIDYDDGQTLICSEVTRLSRWLDHGLDP